MMPKYGLLKGKKIVGELEMLHSNTFKNDISLEYIHINNGIVTSTYEMWVKFMTPIRVGYDFVTPYICDPPQ